MLPWEIGATGFLFLKEEAGDNQYDPFFNEEEEEEARDRLGSLQGFTIIISRG